LWVGSDGRDNLGKLTVIQACGLGVCKESQSLNDSLHDHNSTGCQ
jgi:hypothetical protein